MLVNLRMILILLTLICFILSAVRVPSQRVELLSLGLAFYVMAQLAVP
jgi:hypothetical protein